jgi:5-methylcytosine-specific restriction endonuclease McrA
MRRPCLTCGTPTQGSRCPHHRPTYDHAWDQLARAAKAAHPWCSRCGSPGPLEVDHIDPTGRIAGVQVLCVDCHHDKTAGQGGWGPDGPAGSSRKTPPPGRLVYGSGAS